MRAFLLLLVFLSGSNPYGFTRFSNFEEGAMCEPKRAPRPFQDSVSLLVCDQPSGWKWGGLWKRAECPKSMVFSAYHKKCVAKHLTKKKQYIQCLPCWANWNSWRYPPYGVPWRPVITQPTPMPQPNAPYQPVQPMVRPAPVISQPVVHPVIHPMPVQTHIINPVQPQPHVHVINPPHVFPQPQPQPQPQPIPLQPVQPIQPVQPLQPPPQTVHPLIGPVHPSQSIYTVPATSIYTYPQDLHPTYVENPYGQTVDNTWQEPYSNSWTDLYGQPNYINVVNSPTPVYLPDSGTYDSAWADIDTENNINVVPRELNEIEKDMLEAQGDLDYEEFRIFKPKPCPGAPPARSGVKEGETCSWMTDPLVADTGNVRYFYECRPQVSGVTCGTWEKIECAKNTIFEQTVQLCLPANFPTKKGSGPAQENKVDHAPITPPTLSYSKAYSTPTLYSYVRPVSATPQPRTYVVSSNKVDTEEPCDSGYEMIGYCNIIFRCPAMSVCNRKSNVCCRRT